jgi:hypothetical protein
MKLASSSPSGVPSANIPEKKRATLYGGALNGLTMSDIAYVCVCVCVCVCELG